MSQSITVTVPHRLGVEEAKRRIATQLDAMRRDYVDKFAASDVAWVGDQANVRVSALGQTVTGQLDVEPQQVRIEVQLPWLLAAMRGRLEGILSTTARNSLQIEDRRGK